MSFWELILVALLDSAGRTSGASSASLTLLGEGFRLRTHRVIPAGCECSQLGLLPLLDLVV